jgi:hypothetical protein
LEDLGEFDPTMKKKKKKKKEFVPDGDEMPLDNDIDGKRCLNFDYGSSLSSREHHKIRSWILPYIDKYEVQNAMCNIPIFARSSIY